VNLLPANKDSEERHSGVQMYSDNFIPNTAHSCSQHGPATAWLTSEERGNVIPVLKTPTLLGA
jgi:hypothetical protein